MMGADSLFKCNIAPSPPLCRPFCQVRRRGRRQAWRRVRAANDADSAKGGPSRLLSVFCPLLKAFSGGDAAAARPRWLEVSTSGLASLARMPFDLGVSAGEAGRARRSQPEKPPRLYEFEACPFCRRVREAITDLDLVVEVYPCPKDAVRHRAAVREAGGKEQFPFLVDENTGRMLYESDAIARYLYETYGGATLRPPPMLLESTLLTGWMPTLLRIGRGMVRYQGAVAEPPAMLLKLWSYESNQFARLVREALAELELPYQLISCGKGSRHRAALTEAAPGARVPYLEDPNTGVAMGESADIVRYLFATYSAGVREAAPAGLELTVFSCKDAYVYKIPPPSTIGHRADTWNVDAWLQEVRCAVVTCGDDCIIRLTAEGTGELFAECPVPKDQPLTTAVEPVVDSSRYFALRLVDRESGRHAFIGLGFRHREAASDFNAALAEYRQYLQRAAAAAKMRAAAEAAGPPGGSVADAPGNPSGPGSYSLKLGETLKLPAVKPRMSAAGLSLSSLSASAATATPILASAGSGAPVLAPPPRARLPRGSSAGASGAAQSTAERTPAGSEPAAAEPKSGPAQPAARVEGGDAAEEGWSDFVG
ncbi:hypothetical protein WJX81_007611 [Elliptochloris bilobata]|uniref:GST N-terminal domain-containing protein n=1 Tax=Elliptochloris bilobata TaxID=381761 RepID=A0AAW1S528_9CHLO